MNGGAQQPLSLGPDNRRLSKPGDFNAEVPLDTLATGQNTVTLRAIDTAGNVSTRVVTLDYEPAAGVSLPYSIDWAAAEGLQSVAQVVDGDWEIASGGLRTKATGYDRLVAFGDMAWEDYTVTVPVTVHSIDTVNGNPYPSNGPLVGLGLRWQGHSAIGNSQPRWGYFPVGAYSWFHWDPDGSTGYQLLREGAQTETSSAALELGETYTFKFRVQTQPDGRGAYAFKAWRREDQEPATWRFEEAGISDLSSGAVVLIAHHADVTFGSPVVDQSGT